MNYRLSFLNPFISHFIIVFVTCSFLYSEVHAQKLVSSQDGEHKSSLVFEPIMPIVTNEIQLNGEGTINDQTLIRVCVDISHPYSEDLEMYLLSPHGQKVELSTHNGSSKAFYNNTCYSTHAEMSITRAITPVEYEYLPEGKFSDFIGSAIAGKWTLSVSDYILEDDGKLNSWSLEVSNNILSREWRTMSKSPSSLIIAKN
tara:strand:+ start:1076 stop:1678 length:603 start_codon:yes stop_codon:yes gene_type:complete